MASSFSQAVSSDGAGGGAAAVPAVEGAVLATLFWELEEVEVVLVAVPDTAAVVTAAAVDPDAAAATVAAGCCWILCLTTRLAVPSFNFFMKFQASILDIRVQSVLLTEIISSPTFNVPFLSAAPPIA